MRWLRLVFAVVVVSSTGCSAFIAGRGENLDEIGSREEVRARFGTPVASGTDARPYDEFRTHRKISNGKYASDLFYERLGLGPLDCVYVPGELFRAVRQRVMGHTLRFEYSADGTVTRIASNGEQVRWVGPYGSWHAQPSRYSRPESNGAGP